MMRLFRLPDHPVCASLKPHERQAGETAFAAHLAALGFRMVAVLAIAHLATFLIAEQGFAVWAACLAVLAIGGAAGASMIAGRATAQMEDAVARNVIDLYAHFIGRGSLSRLAETPAGELISQIDRQPALCARGVVTVPLAKQMAVFGPAAALVVIALLHWPSAIILTLAMPLMVIGLIVTGRLTKTRAEKHHEALDRLAGGFAERVRCLPTILSSHAEKRESLRLGRELSHHRQATMSVLRVAFLNTAVLDIVSTMMVAGLAISLAAGTLSAATLPGFAGVSLGTTLAILALVPELFGPLRRFAEIYHTAAEARAALEHVEPLTAVETTRDTRLPAERFGLRGAVSAVNGPYPDMDLPCDGLVVVVGPSGCGKTTLLRLLAGVDAPLRGQVFKPVGTQAWAATDAHLPGHRVADAIEKDAARWLDAVGLAHDPRFSAGGDTRLGAGAQALSGGQRLRLSIAAAAASSAETIFVDEPTAKLDENSAEHIRRLLIDLADRRLVIAATHDPKLIAYADLHIELRDLAKVQT
ncbi:MAG: ATP-binding cassette domain-containing protein [Pseudomonadota bacterium]